MSRNAFQVVQRQLLHLVRSVAALEVLAERVALDGVREDDRRLALVSHRGGVRGVNLAVVVATTLEVPDFGIREVLDQFLRARVATEEVITHERAVVGLVRLEIAVRGHVHQVDERAVLVGMQQRIPLTAPDDLDDIPACAAEERLQFLDDLAVTANRAVEALQVAVDDERQIVEAFGRSHVRETARLRLVHLAVAEEGPHMLIGGVLDAAIIEVMVVSRLVDGIHRAEAHGYRRELPEIGEQARVRVRRESAALVGVALLLAEAVHLLGRDAAFEECSRVDAGEAWPWMKMWSPPPG